MAGDLSGRDALYKTMLTVEQLVAQALKASYGRGQYIEQTLESVKPPANPNATLPSGATLATSCPLHVGPAEGTWRRNVIRVYEEIEMRKQRDMPLP